MGRLGCDGVASKGRPVDGCHDGAVQSSSWGGSRSYSDGMGDCMLCGGCKGGVVEGLPQDASRTSSVASHDWEARPGLRARAVYRRRCGCK